MAHHTVVIVVTQSVGACSETKSCTYSTMRVDICFASLTRGVVTQSAQLVAVGCAIGLVTAYVMGSALTKLVYGVSATDPAALAISIGLLFLIAVLASVMPVRRALRVDPMDTLRAE